MNVKYILKQSYNKNNNNELFSLKCAIMRIRYLKMKNWLFATLLGALGFSACNSSKNAAKGQENVQSDEPVVAPRPEVMAMYGVPTIDYKVRGKVVSETGKPLQGIQVVLINNTINADADTIYGNASHIDNYVREASDTTDAKGEFETHVKDMPSESIRLLVRDRDGEINGLYENVLMEIPISQDDVKNEGQGWFLGTAEKEVSVKLREMEP